MGFDTSDLHRLIEVQNEVRGLADSIKRLERTVEYLARRESPAQTFEQYYQNGIAVRMGEINHDHVRVEDRKRKEDNAAYKFRMKKERERVDKMMHQYEDVWATSLSGLAAGTGHFHPSAVLYELIALYFVGVFALYFWKAPANVIIAFSLFAFPVAYAALHLFAMFMLYMWHPADYKKARPYERYMQGCED